MASISKSVKFMGVRFPSSVYREALKIADEITLSEWKEQIEKYEAAKAAASDPYTYVYSVNPPQNSAGEPANPLVYFSTMSIQSGDVEWGFDSLDDFLSELAREHQSSSFTAYAHGSNLSLLVRRFWYNTDVGITHSSRSVVQRVMSPFEEYAQANPAPESSAEMQGDTKPRIFIGHGGQSSDWLLLQNELQNVHKLDVEAFESGERAGHHIRSILEGFLEHNTFAVLVLSKEDEQSDGNFRARQNVVHEAGLFQGKLGFDRALILVEKGTSLFSNLDGIQHIEYEPGQIRGAVGRLLAVIAREHSHSNGGR